jgi:hypothetical protein
VDPHPTRPIKPATAANLAYRMNTDTALTSNQDVRQRFRQHLQHRDRHVLTDSGGSTANGTRLVMAPGNGDQSYPWRVFFHPYPKD